jgi:class 3 adenylate cyclase
MTSEVAPASVERRIVSVLFADLVGFTTLSERLDAEDVATIQDAYFATVRETIARYGGQLEKFIGDAAMAVFGVPRGHDDDAERAVRTALALVAGVDQLGVRLGIEGGGLRLRVGVNTGEVVHATDGPDAGRVTGDTVNTAARFQTAAQPGGVLVGQETALAVADAILLEAVAPLELKGKGRPVPAWRATGIRPQRSRELAMGSLHAPTIGRDRELATFLGRLTDVRSHGRSERWLVLAPPGVGKTRLVDELTRRLEAEADPPFVRRLRVRPETSGFEALGPLATAAIGDGPDLVGRLTQAGLPTARARVVAAELLDLAGLASGAESPGLAGSAHRPSSAADRSARFAAWLEGLDALAADRVDVWIVEDVHWAGPDVVAFLDEAVARSPRRGRLVVATARPSFVERAPGWAEDDTVAGHRVLALTTLDPADASTLVRSLVGDALPDALVRRIAERSDGNCLFVEELLRSWVGTGALVRGDAGWTLTIDPDEAALPSTVQAIYAAQLDDLPAEARTAARRGSVAGRRFPLAALDVLGVDEADVAIEELARRALVSGPFADPTTGDAFASRHALRRDAGYASLARAERAELHVRLARWLEAAAGADADALAAAIGDHLGQAFESAPALAREVAPGLDRDACADAAASWFERAGARALRDGATASAAGHFRRSVELTRTALAIERSRRRTRLGRALAPIGGVEEATAAFEEAMDDARAARSTGDARWRTTFADAADALATLLFERIRFVDAWRLGDAALEEMGEADDLPTARLRVARSRGRTGETNDASGWVADCERAIETARAAGDADAEYDLRCDLGRARSEAGTATGADWTELAELAATRGDVTGEVSARLMEAAYRMDEAPAETLKRLPPTRDLAVARGLVERLGWIDQLAAEAALGAGEWDTTIEAGLRATTLGERHGYDRISVRSWTALLPAASLRGEREVLERAAAWFAERQGRLPDSPYGHVLHAACGLRIAAGLGQPLDPSDLDQIRPAIPLWIDQGGYEWPAATDAILDAWFAAGRLDWIRVVTEGAAPRLPSEPSPAQLAALELARVRLEAALGEVDREREGRTRRVLAAFRSIGLPYWEARAIRVLEAFGAATAGEAAEREAIEARLGVVRPTLE